MAAQIAAAMSGGVDSAAAAFLLKEQGHDLIGVTMTLLPGERAEADARDARAVARQLGVPHYTFPFAESFRAQVVEPFVCEYERGRTPNPCVACNRCIKFGRLLSLVREMGRERLATGHYARLDFDAGSGRHLLKTARHPDKDQSYVLCTLTQDQLAHSLFPLGELTKEQVRELAREQGLSSAHRRDSQDICFVPDGDYAAFIRRHTGRDYPPGPFVDGEGRVLGTHRGIIHYTLGQRRGLGVSWAERLYVRRIDPAANTVTLTSGGGLYARELEAGHINLIPCAALSGPVRVQAKARYRQPPQSATAEQTGPDRLRVVFDQPQRALTPGQTVALYDGDVVVGGGTIDYVKED